MQSAINFIVSGIFYFESSALSLNVFYVMTNHRPWWQFMLQSFVEGMGFLSGMLFVFGAYQFVSSFMDGPRPYFEPTGMEDHVSEIILPPDVMQTIIERANQRQREKTLD